MLRIKATQQFHTLWIILCLGCLSLTACNQADQATTNITDESQVLPAQSEWLMEGFNPQRTRATTAQASPPLTLQQEFRVDGDAQFGSPVGVAGGNIFIEGKRKLHAFSLDQGQEQWAFNLPGSFVSPAINDNQVIVRAESGTEGYIFALTADTGLKLWQFKFPRVGSADGDLGGHVTSPVIVDGLVIVGASKTFNALDAQTGDLVWSFQTEEPIGSSASIIDNTVYFVDFDNLYALDLATGEEQWRFLQEGLSLLFAPIIVEDQVVTANRDMAYVLDRHSGELLWQKKVPDERLIPAGASK
ncbi:MAG: PQQ-binding-like beta-propeller repeat protein, partial [Chloroflexota bacterium]